MGLSKAKLDSGMNQHSRDVIVSSTEMNTVAKQQELARTASNKAVDKSDSIAFLMKTPAKRRMTADEKAAAQKQAQGEKAAAAEVKAAATKKVQEEKQAVVKAKAAERERQRQEASVQKEALQMERKRIAEQKREAKCDRQPVQSALFASDFYLSRVLVCPWLYFDLTGRHRVGSYAGALG